MRDWSYATEHSVAVMRDFLELFQMWHRFSGSTAHWQDWKKVRPLISFYIADIQPFLLDMQAFMRCACACLERRIQIRKPDHLQWQLCRGWMTNVPSGKLLRISAILYMVHRWSLPHTSLQNVFRRDSESSKELQIRIILRTVIMYMYLSRSMHLTSWSSRQSSRNCRQEEQSAILKSRICSRTFRQSFLWCSSSTSILCMQNWIQRVTTVKSVVMMERFRLKKTKVESLSGSARTVGTMIRIRCQ